MDMIINYEMLAAGIYEYNKRAKNKKIKNNLFRREFADFEYLRWFKIYARNYQNLLFINFSELDKEYIKLLINDKQPFDCSFMYHLNNLSYHNHVFMWVCEHKYIKAIKWLYNTYPIIDVFKDIHNKLKIYYNKSRCYDELVYYFNRFCYEVQELVLTLFKSKD